MTTAIIMAGTNVFGRMVLKAMIDAGRPPALVINERGTARAERLSRWLAEISIDGPELRSVLGPERIRLVEVDNFQGETAHAALMDAKPDYLVNGGAGIFKPKLLAMPRRGVLNVHPGLLPEFRGLDPVLWALEEDGPIGATLHLVSDGIDEGPILIREEIETPMVESVVKVRLACMAHGIGLLTRFLANPDLYSPREQRPESARYLGAFPAQR